MLGLGSSLTLSSTPEGAWATKFLSLNGEENTFAKVVNMQNLMGGISAGGGDDIGDNFTLSFWVRPMWVMSSASGNQSIAGTDASGSASAENNVPFISMGSTETELDRIRANYILDTSGGSDRNRLQAQLLSDSSNKNHDEWFLHSGNNQYTGTGSTLDSSGVNTGWWHANNTGNANDQGFVHVVMCRGTDEWLCYWNAQALGDEININAGTVAMEEAAIDELWIGKNFGNQSTVPGGYRDISIFKKQLDASEVSELYNSGELWDVRKHSASSDLGLYWPCEDNLEHIQNAPLVLSGEATFSVVGMSR